MKKNNNLMRASGILLVLTMATSCFVGGTFAKYTTSKDITVEARVAKWGITLTNPTPENQGFYKQYLADETSTDIRKELGMGDDSVAGTNGKIISVKSVYDNSNVMAPGTKGTFAGIEIEADKPEVAYQVKTTATVTITGWELKDGTFYCPLQFTVCDVPINGLDYDNAGALQNAIIAAVAEDPRSNFIGEAGEDYFVDEDAGRFSWEWKFADAQSTDGENDQTDTKDTELGEKLANDSTEDDPTISIQISTDVTQIN